MSYSGSNAHELTARLLAALDSQYDVVDVHAVNEIISVLEKIHITKELLETTRLGKHVNLLRRRARDASLARRAKVLVKRWRDLVIPSADHGSTGSHSNRSSVDRHPRPLTSPALTRHVVSPVVPSPKSSSRPGWSGYDSDSNDVILVDDEPCEPRLAAPVHAPVSAPVSAPVLTPTRTPGHQSPTSDGKRSKKPKKKRGHSRAGSGADAAAAWAARNGGAGGPAAAAAVPPRRNGCTAQADAYRSILNKLPPAGAKKVKTTRELLEAIQSRAAPAASPPAHPAPPAGRARSESPEVLLVDSPPPPPVSEHASPLRNGGRSPVPAPTPALSPAPPLPPPSPPPDEEPYPVCTCEEDVCDARCEAAGRLSAPTPLDVWTLHRALVPGVNGTRAPAAPHPHAVRRAPAADGRLFASVVPLYRYLDYADDYCTKNQRVDLCPSLPRWEFAPSPPAPPPAPSPPPVRPYPLDDAPPPTEGEAGSESKPIDEDVDSVQAMEVDVIDSAPCEMDISGDRTEMDSDQIKIERVKSENEGVSEKKSVKNELDDVRNELDDVRNEINDVRYETDDIRNETDDFEKEADGVSEIDVKSETNSVTNETEVKLDSKSKKCDLDGRTLYSYCERACAAASLGYSSAFAAPVVTWGCGIEEVDELFAAVESETIRDELGRPERPRGFAEWHEAARLTEELVALPYVVID